MNTSYRLQNKSIGRMLNIMDSYYSNMKKDMGIFEKNHYEGEDQQLDDVLKALRPNTTAKNFRDFLSRQENVNRSQHWKNISRKLDEETHPPQPYSSMGKKFMNKRAVTQNQKIEDIIQVIETKGKDAVKKGDLINLLSNYNKSTNMSTQEAYLPTSQKSVNLLGQTQRSNFHNKSAIYGNSQNNSYLETSQMGRSREGKQNFKAELVRHELLSRSDLMKLYQPPIKKS